MSSLTNTLEAIVFASGEAVPVKYVIEKLHVSLKEVNTAIDELKQKYNENCGIVLLTFNGKIQFASNPKFKQEVSDVLTPIKEKELSKTILECAALIAYKQPVTKSELEEIRNVSCDYAIHTLLELDMIYPCGRKDAVGKPILYATTDNFLKRFKLNSIDELPDYDDLMAQIAELNNAYLSDEDDSNYLYKKDEYVEEADSNVDGDAENAVGAKEKNNVQAEPVSPKNADDMEVPDFLKDDDMVITIT